MVISVSRNIFSVYKAVKRHTSLVAAAAPATNSGVRRHWTCMTISCRRPNCICHQMRLGSKRL